MLIARLDAAMHAPEHASWLAWPICRSQLSSVLDGQTQGHTLCAPLVYPAMLGAHAAWGETTAFVHTVRWPHRMCGE